MASQCNHQVFARRLPEACDKEAQLTHFELSVRCAGEAASIVLGLCNVFAMLLNEIAKPLQNIVSIMVWNMHLVVNDALD
jgi:hypothetical protein